MAAFSTDWLFNKTDYINNTPSRLDGTSLAEERITRRVGMKFLLKVSWNLSIPQSTIATAATYYHRFFMLRSFKRHHKYEIAGACILLACKTEETMRKISQVSSSCAKFARRDLSPYIKNEEEIEAWSRIIKKKEPMIAATLCFDLAINKPYKVLLDFLKKLKGVDKNDVQLQNFSTHAWAIINDSYLTPMCLFQKPETIASAAIYLAAQMIDFQLNINPSNGLLWWEVTDCNVRELGICVQEILDSYRIPRGEEMSDVRENGNSISTNLLGTNDNLNREVINSGSTTPLNVNSMNHTTHVEIRNGVHTPYDNPTPSSNTITNGVTPVQDDEMEDGQIVEDETANGQIDEDEMDL